MKDDINKFKNGKLKKKKFTKMIIMKKLIIKNQRD